MTARQSPAYRAETLRVSSQPSVLCDGLRLPHDGALIRRRIRRHERRVDVALVSRGVEAVEIEVASNRGREPWVVHHARHVADRYAEAQLAGEIEAVDV